MGQLKEKQTLRPLLFLLLLTKLPNEQSEQLRMRGAPGSFWLPLQLNHCQCELIYPMELGLFVILLRYPKKLT